MKVEVYKSVDIETDVTIDTDDIREALLDALRCAEHSMNPDNAANERTKQFDVCQFVLAAWQCLSAVTDEMIATCTDKQREPISKRLHEQAQRWEIKQ